MEGPDPRLAAVRQKESSTRAARQQIRIPLRYRLAGAEEWSLGETINVSESGLLFASNQLLEIQTRLEITFQISGAPLLPRSMRHATIVRRVLSNWPETQLLFGARYTTL
ncbi:MAG TPA: PilZ domain-containing protein [Candidatus Limnocylindrales bacterium]|jgi:hypothetical protein|nr:PilZ domain-containing protein [Candidatus Limnocylindrales bacterium]